MFVTYMSTNMYKSDEPDIFPILTHYSFLYSSSDSTRKTFSDVSLKWILGNRFTVFEVIILIHDFSPVGVFFSNFSSSNFAYVCVQTLYIVSKIFLAWILRNGDLQWKKGLSQNFHFVTFDNGIVA